MTAFYYIVLPQEFCEQNRGYQEGCCRFAFDVTEDGRHVVPLAAPNAFPELFAGMSLPAPVALTPDDFPQYDDEGNLIVNEDMQQSSWWQKLLNLLPF